MAYDEQDGVVVALVDDSAPGMQTWTLDVGALAWTERSRAEFATTWTRLVYDPATDFSVAVTELGATYAYDVAADAWTPRATRGGSSIGRSAVAALDTDSGRIVTLPGVPATDAAWAYSAADDTWQQIGQSRPAPSDRSPFLVSYVPTIDTFVAISGGSGSLETVTWTFDAGSGTWAEVDTRSPSLNFVFGDLSSGTEMIYASATDRVVVFTDGVLAEYDPIGRTWTSTLTPDLELVEGLPIGRLARIGASLVYDSTNERVLVYGGRARLAEGWRMLDDLWAYDPATRRWTMLLDATQFVDPLGVE
jgi:hypothetical protein